MFGYLFLIKFYFEMSDCEEKMLMYSKDDQWKNSTESIVTQKVTKLTISDTVFRIPSDFGSDVTFRELELREINVDDLKPKGNWELVRDKSHFPRMIQTRSLLRDELEILKINMSLHEKAVALKEPELIKYLKTNCKKNKKEKLIKCWKKPEKFLQKFLPVKVKDLLTEIEGSESAKTDTVIWKFLKRGSFFRKELTKQFLLEMHAWNSSDSYMQSTQPTRITCPNCRFFITTDVRRVSTLRTKFASLLLAIFGLCFVPHIFYVFKDTVHLCPLCKIYLGFCPALGLRYRKEKWWLSERKQSKHLIEKEIAQVDNSKMVSASSTSAKNLFVESKLRLSDRVQVNVNNIAAVARQIQRGSKANDNLIAAAKNFALQEAAIENSETNLRKLKLLTTHITSQLDSLQSNSSKMEMVLEQVRSMQR